MANVDHTSLTDTQCHEPKGINSATTADKGKVITPSGTTSGESVLRKLTHAELLQKQHHVMQVIGNISAASTVYIAPGISGTLVKATSVIDGALDSSGSDATITFNIDGSASDAATMTIAASGSATGTVDSVTSSANNILTSNSYIAISSDGASTNSVRAAFVLQIQESDA